MIALLLLAVLVLVLLNAFFVAAEFALVRSRKAHLQTDADEGKKGAATAVTMMDDLSRYLSAAQVGITLTSLGLGFLGEPAIGSLIENLFGEEVPHWVSTTISVTLAYLITTSIHITLGEQVPKIYAIQKAEPVARWVARPLLVFSKVFRPFISAAQRGLQRDPADARRAHLRPARRGRDARGAAGADPGVGHRRQAGRGRGGDAHGRLPPARAAGAPGHDAGAGGDHGRRRPRTSRPRCAAACRRGHTRLVVTEDENRDRVKGIVHSNQLAQLLLAEGPSATVDGLVREVPIVPETKPLDDLLADLQRQRSSLAVVIDEYGRTAGIVTVEDIIEEVVGEIDDETDPQGGEVRRLANGDWFVRGHVAITDLIDYGLELPVDSDAYNSVGGFVFGELGRLPKRGDTVIHNGYSIRVESVRENRIEAVRIRDRHVPRAETNVQS